VGGWVGGWQGDGGLGCGLWSLVSPWDGKREGGRGGEDSMVEVDNVSWGICSLCSGLTTVLHLPLKV
jgi:hypothetical protein